MVWNFFNRGIMMRQKHIKDIFFIGVFILGVIFLRIFYITRTTGPFIYADEFGYWSHAAHLAGYVWAGAMDGVSWYSFGYSLWLALTFLFSNQMVVMYRIAIGINILMCLGIYGLTYGIVTRLTKEQNTFTCGLIAFAATSFPTYIFYSYTTMCETLLALVVWLLFYELVSLEENPVWWKGLLLGMTAGYAYMVHNRMLTALLAVAICLTVLWLTNRIDWKMIVSFAVAVLAVLFYYIFLKEFLENMIANNRIFAETQTTIVRGKANTFGKIWKNFLSIFTLKNIIRPILSLMGQLWQCLSATYLLAGLGTVYVVRGLKKSFEGRQSICMYAYPFFSVLFSVGLTSVVALGPKLGVTGRIRIDSAFYGRYNECYYALLIMMALVLLCERKWGNTLRICLGVIAVYLALSMGMLVRLSGVDEGYLNIVSSVGIHIFHWLGDFSVFRCTVIALLGGVGIWGLCSLRKMGRLGYYAGLFLLVFLFSTTALYCMRASIRGENDYTKQYVPLYDYLNENTVKGEVVYTTAENKPVFDLQTRLVDKPVVAVPAGHLNTLKEEAYVVVRNEQMEEIPVKEYDVCLECEELIVLKWKGCTME